MVNVNLASSNLTGNGGSGLSASLNDLTSSSAAISVTINGLNSSNNGFQTIGSRYEDGFYFTNEHDTQGQLGPAGTILVENSTSNGDAKYGMVAAFYDANAASLKLQNNSIVNANATKTTYDNAAVGVVRGTANPMGNVSVSGLSVQDTKGYISYYFTVENYSGTGGEKTISIGSFGSLSGATGSTYGILNGTGVNSVSIP